MTTVGGKFTTRKRNLVTYVEDTQYELLRELAERNERSVSAEAARAIQKYIQEQQGTEVTVTSGKKSSAFLSE